MNLTGRLLLFAALIPCLKAASTGLVIGDAARGRNLFGEKECLACHSVNQRGGTKAPDLALSVTRGFSPYNLAALLWNHVPGMAAAWRSTGKTPPELTGQDAADLFAYFYASRYFEEPGNPGRGRDVFRTKACAGCHGLTVKLRQGAPPVAAWQSISDPLALASRMWNHSPEMRQAMGQAGVAYPKLSANELTDLLAYLRQQSGEPAERREFSPGSPDQGRLLLSSKRCVSCHLGTRALEERPTRYTLIDFVASFWNHPPGARRAAPTISQTEMSDLVAYLLVTQFSEEHGDVERGRRVYAGRRCAQCHENPSSGAPQRATMLGHMNSYGMMSAAWKHGPGMLAYMQARKRAWPTLNAGEMADLIAFLNGQRLRQRHEEKR